MGSRRVAIARNRATSRAFHGRTVCRFGPACDAERRPPTFESEAKVMSLSRFPTSVLVARWVSRVGAGTPLGIDVFIRFEFDGLTRQFTFCPAGLIDSRGAGVPWLRLCVLAGGTCVKPPNPHGLAYGAGKMLFDRTGVRRKPPGWHVGKCTCFAYRPWWQRQAGFLVDGHFLWGIG